MENRSKRASGQNIIHLVKIDSCEQFAEISRYKESHNQDDSGIYALSQAFQSISLKNRNPAFYHSLLQQLRQVNDIKIEAQAIMLTFKTIQGEDYSQFFIQFKTVYSDVMRELFSKENLIKGENILHILVQNYSVSMF